MLAIENITQRANALRQLRQREQELVALNETLEARVESRTRQVRSLSSQLAIAEREERRRVSQLLHDDLQQRLYSLQLQVTLLRGLLDGDDAEAAEVEIAEIERVLHDAIAVTRHLSIDLSPPILYDEGLAEALGWLASQMRERHGLAVEVRSENSFPIPDQGLLTILFQMVRELLFNAVKHGDADHAVVTLTAINGSVRIEVRDDGRGFRPDTALQSMRSGLGLHRIRQRLHLLEGEMTVESAAGAGTCVTIVAPLDFPRPLYEADPPAA